MSFQPRLRTIPGFEGADCPVRRVAPGPGGGIALSHDPEAVGRGPLRRDRGPAYLPGRGNPRRRIEDQALQREGFRPVLGPNGHIARFEAAAGVRAAAVTGCGNLGLNSGVRAAAGGAWIGIEGVEGHAIQIAGGRGRPIPPGSAVPEGFGLSGPRLVAGGRAGLSGAASFADPRHLLLFPYIQIRPGRAVDFGTDRLLSCEDAYDRAAAGETVELPLLVPVPANDLLDSPIRREPVEPEALRRALAVKGYREARGAPRARGEFSLDRNALRLRFLEGIYPHHALVVDGSGLAQSVLVGGLGNRAGAALREFAEDLAAAGAREAVLLDNGGDVGLYDARLDRFEITPSEPDRRRAWPLSACLIYTSDATIW